MQLLCTRDCVHELFQRHADDKPDVIAIVFEDHQISYGELNRRANNLAWRLREMGVGTETRVGLYIQRGIAMYVSLLGILKSGAAYVALDPEYPIERLTLMLEDAQASVIVTEEKLHKKLPAGWAQVITVEVEQWSADENHQQDLQSSTQPSNLAYIIFTSGSTGRPKAVALTHGGVCNLAAAQRSAFSITAASNILQFSSLSFDASVSEWATALLTGARLIVAHPDNLMSGVLLENLCVQEQVSVATVPPSILANWSHIELPALETLIVAGEPCGPELTERWAGGRQMMNAYGPTETTVCATISERLLPGAWPPIGRPIWNTFVYNLDQWMEPVPVGVGGELYIGGAGLARGYLNRPELTAERFVPNPFSEEEGTRLYRSGDRVRWLADGTLEFLGRIDEQVKLRGYRIEPGEIESVLLQEVGVKQAVVILREDEPGDKRLVAYLVGEPGAPTKEALRSALAARLPGYMIPSAFVYMDGLPLTANGKLNRRALPKVEVGVGVDGEQVIGPRTATEEILVGVWAEVLRLREVGVHDNFFDLGGHSLLATQVMSRVSEAINLQLPLRMLFEAPTVTDLAREVEAARQGGSARPPALAAVEREQVLPLSFAQQRLWFLDQLEPGSAVYNMPQAIRLEGAVEIEGLQWALSEIMRRHEVLRTTFPVEGGKRDNGSSRQRAWNCR